MTKKDFLLLVCSLSIIVCIFFAKIIFSHQIPLPADLLIDTTPFNMQSYLGYGPGGYPNKGQGRDVITQLYPWKYFSIHQLQNHTIPLWNPYNFSGNEHIANYQTGVFYPLNILFFLMPFIPAWTVFIILQPILAIIFQYIFLRDLELSEMSSLFGSVAFGFCSYLTVWLEWGNIGHTFLWLPLLLFSLRRLVHERKVRYAVFLTVAGTACLLAGYIQGAFYVLALTGIYTLVLLLHKKIRSIKLISAVIGAFCLMLLLAAVQVLPTLSDFMESARSTYSLSQIQNLLQPWYYPVTIFVSDFFGNPATRNYLLPITYFERVMYAGIPLLFFAIYAVQKVKKLEVSFFAFVSLVVLLLTTNLPGISLLYQLPLPILSTTVPTRALSLFIFSIIILGSFGIDYWIKKQDLKSLAPFLFVGVYGVLWIGILIAGRFFPQLQSSIAVIKHNMIFSSGIAFLTVLLFYLRYKNVLISSVLLGILIIFDTFYIFMKFTPFAPASLIYPQTPVITYIQQHAGINRSWGYGSVYIPANYATMFGIYSADGYDPLFQKDYGRLLNSSATGKVVLPLSRTDANIAPGSGFGRLPDNVYRQKLLDVLGVKYVLHSPFTRNASLPETGVFPEDYYKFIWHDEHVQIYQNLHAYPRFFLAGQYALTTEDTDIRDFYETDLAKTVSLYVKPLLPLDASASGTVTLEKYKPNKIRFVTNTSGNELLFLSDTYDNEWQAAIDGSPTFIYKADVAFRAIAIPKGKHTIVMTYQPEEFILGLVISLVTLIVGCSYLLIAKILEGS